MPAPRKTLHELERDRTFVARKHEHLLGEEDVERWRNGGTRRRRLFELVDRYGSASDDEARRELALAFERAVRDDWRRYHALTADDEWEPPTPPPAEPEREPTVWERRCRLVERGEGLGLYSPDQVALARGDLRLPIFDSDWTDEQREARVVWQRWDEAHGYAFRTARGCPTIEDESRFHAQAGLPPLEWSSEAFVAAVADASELYWAEPDAVPDPPGWETLEELLGERPWTFAGATREKSVDVAGWARLMGAIAGGDLTRRFVGPYTRRDGTEVSGYWRLERS